MTKNKYATTHLEGFEQNSPEIVEDTVGYAYARLEKIVLVQAGYNQNLYSGVHTFSRQNSTRKDNFGMYPVHSVREKFKPFFLLKQNYGI